MDKNKINYIAIDLGTNSTRVYIKNVGIIYNEPSMYAFDTEKNSIIAYGIEAKRLFGKHKQSVHIVQPIKNGVITDMQTLRVLLNKILENHSDKIKDSIMCLSCPLSLTILERNALVDLIKGLGSYHVEVVSDIVLSAIGTGIKIDDTEGYLLIDMGAGKSTAATIVAGEVISYKWTKQSGISIDQEIVKYIRTKHSIVVGDLVGEQVKVVLSSLIKQKVPQKLKIFGLDVTTGMPKEVEITDNEILKIVQAIMINIANLVTQLLEETPNELALDVIKNGVILTGGLAKTLGIKEFFEDYFEIPVRVAKNAVSCTIDGAIALEDSIRNKLGLNKK